MPKQPIAEIFGFPINNLSPEAVRYRTKRLCPFNNKVPNCTKDKAEDPLGVCSIFEGEKVVVTCPIRFRQDWILVDAAAGFFFPPDAKWTSLTEVRLDDKQGKTAGNIDIVLLSYDDSGKVVDFGALEVQAVYISGTIRSAFKYYMSDPISHVNMDWSKQRNYPRPDYVSSSRKRLAPQLLFKGGILHAWNKKQAVAVDKNFFATLPQMDEVPQEEAELAWLIYDLQLDSVYNRYQQYLVNTVYTRFESALKRLTVAEPGDITQFIAKLQKRLQKELDAGESLSPTVPT